MNKLVLLILISTVALAKPFTGNFSTKLEYKTNLNYSQKFTLERKDKKIIYNGIILSPEKILVAHDYISYLVMNESTERPTLKCPQGTYTYSVTKDDKTSKEEGCIGGQRFGELTKAFKSI